MCTECTELDVVEELDSSNKHEKKDDPNTKPNIEESTNDQFTIVHIPEDRTCQNADEKATSLTTNAPEVTAQTSVQTITGETLPESGIEQQFADLVGNLDLDLIVKTYEALQSCDDAGALIENWLADCSEGEQQNGKENLTLEENLKCFTQFSQKVKPAHAADENNE